MVPVFEFLTDAGTDEWRVINDTVMGGVSNGQLAWTDGVLAFTGELSLANNGGFVSIRSPEIDPVVAVEWAARSGIRAEIEGDGRTWTIEVRTDGDAGGWVSTFPTPSAGRATVDLPWTSFEPVTRFLEPRQATEPLDPSDVETLGFFLVDGIEGSYRLGLHSIG